MRQLLLVYLLFLLGLGLSLALMASPRDDAAWAIPLMVSPSIHLQVKAASLIELLSSEPGRHWLNGRVLSTRFGPLYFSNQSPFLVVRCAPCRLDLPSFAAEPVLVDEVLLKVQRDEQGLSGFVQIRQQQQSARLQFAGWLSPQGLSLNWQMQRTSLARLFSLVQAAIPEAAHAQILGALSLQGTLQLPARQWTAFPKLEGFEVYGLGTERLRYGPLRLNCPAAATTSSGDGAATWLPISAVGRWVPMAVVATEDAHFYRHPGYELGELLPLLADPRRREYRGASTITQQLAKNFFVGGERRDARKLRELLYAVEMERTLSKARILTLYLNTVDWGPGLCGIQAASQFYFQKAPKQLSATEAAWLAGILRNPHRAYQQEYIPNDISRGRLNWVLSQLPVTESRRRKIAAETIVFADR